VIEPGVIEPGVIEPGVIERRRPIASDDGQAAVEFAASLPIVVVVLLAIVQVGVSIRNELAVELAAREAVRAASVTVDPAHSATAAARRAVSLPVDVVVEVSGRDVTATVEFTDPTDVPLIGWAIGPVTHRATATMVLEPP
jgi:hypothetical protein